MIWRSCLFLFFSALYLLIAVRKLRDFWQIQLYPTLIVCCSLFLMFLAAYKIDDVSTTAFSALFYSSVILWCYMFPSPSHRKTNCFYALLPNVSPGMLTKREQALDTFRHSVWNHLCVWADVVVLESWSFEVLLRRYLFQEVSFQYL